MYVRVSALFVLSCVGREASAFCAQGVLRNVYERDAYNGGTGVPGGRIGLWRRTRGGGGEEEGYCLLGGAKLTL